MHWGDSNRLGSEHLIDSERFLGELHAVHWNSSKYASPEEAFLQKGGLAVLGIFIKVRIIIFIKNKNEKHTHLKSLAMKILNLIRLLVN
jgi:hypothetical protein